MSFFGFDTSLPKDRGHNPIAPGFSQAPDPFAGLARPDHDDEEALDFEETYDGLGDQLDETDDIFNEDTFGTGDASTTSQKPVGKDFDFYGQTAKVSDAINEEQLRFSRQQPPTRLTSTSTLVSPLYHKPARSGYERYKDPGYLTDLRADDSLWGDTAKNDTINVEQQSTSVQPQPTSGRKMMSLEEVEAQMRAQAKKSVQAQSIPSQQQASKPLFSRQSQQQAPEPQYTQQHHLGYASEQRQQHIPVHQNFSGANQEFARQPPSMSHQPQPVQILQRSHVSQTPIKANNIISPNIPATVGGPTQPQPVQILQNPKRTSGDYQRQPQITPSTYPVSIGSRQSVPVISNPQQLTSMTEEQRTAFLAEEAKRAKRNHKIFLLSKDNGLMTPQDKNFITRVQLQQLVTATGSPNEHGTDVSLSEDFYYQVHSQIRGGPRQHPNQPLSNFAQTYLFQTGGRSGNMRRQVRGGDNHMQRMEQQVQRAVEAAKNKPKNKQLVIEGSLGKISFSNAKTPKPLLNIKRADIGNDANRPGSATRMAGDRKSQQVSVSGTDRKTVLRDIENVYQILMQMEDHERQRPSQNTANEIDVAFRNLQIEWDAKFEELNGQLWRDLKVHEPVDLKARDQLTVPKTHPFIAFLSFNKGKKAIPRIFRQLTQQQRTITLTMIVVHLDRLDVVSQAVLSGDSQPPASIREKVDLFSIAVMPSLFGYLSDAGLDIVTSVLSIIVDMTNVDVDARTRIGVSMLTMVLSRAELIKQANATSEHEWEIWVFVYNKFFDALEPALPHIFPGTVNTGEDVYVWQFLAAIGIGASPDQQQRLVIAVKDRVMETVALAKTLPPAMSSQRLANVNLFMRSIGLDVELLG